MHAFLVTGGTKESRLIEISNMLNDREVSSFNRTMVKREEESIGVGEVRDFTKKLSLAPYQGNVLAGIIEDAHLLTTGAQNALLKTLEEPSPKSILFLETVNADLLLPTITSRCQVISLAATEPTSEDLAKITQTLEKIQQSTIGEQIKMVDTIAGDRETANRWVEKAIVAAQKRLITERSNASVLIVRNLLKAQRQLAANVTPKLVLDNVFLSSG